MAKPSIDQIIWIFNKGTGQVDIVEGGKVLESCKLTDAASRLRYHRHQAAKRSSRTFVTASPMRRQRVRVKEAW